MGTNQLADEVKKAEAAQTPPSDAQLRAELEDERRKAAFFQGAAQAEWQRAEQASRIAQTPMPPPGITDPYAKLAADDPLLDPEKKARLLDEGARGRAREEVNRAMMEERARRQMEDQERESRMALRMFQTQHPEVLSDTENFAAAMTKAKIRADAKGMRLDPIGMLQLGMQVYNEGKAPAPNTPYTEGSGVPGAGGAVSKKDEPAPLSMAEELYGATDFIDERKVSMDDYTMKYLDDRNSDLVEKEKFWSAIRNVVGTLREAKGRKAAGR